MTNQKNWWQDAVIYEVYVDKFAGNFSGLIDRLPYLEKLGINCIWILPHYPSEMIDDGYDIDDYFNVRKELGTLSDFDHFIQAAHARSMKVIIDLVLNHTSIRHPWFRDARTSMNSPWRDFYIWSSTKDKYSYAVNPFDHLKAQNWIFNPQTGDYYFASFYPEQADLNWDNPSVKKFIFGVVDFWMEYGVDGFRLDAVPFLFKRDGTDCTHQPEVHHLIKSMRSHVSAKNPEAILLAEANGSPEQIKEYFGKGDECQLAFHFPLLPVLYRAIKENDPALAFRALKETQKIPQGCSWVVFLTNHDDISFRFNSVTERDMLLAFLDPDGKYTFKKNQTVALRLATAFKNNPDIIKGVFSLLLDLPAVPVIYYGEEIGMQNMKFEETPFDMRRYMRGVFDWKLAEKQVADPDSIFNFVRKKIQQHKTAE